MARSATGLPDHALVSDFIQNGYWNLPPNCRMAGQCLMQEIALCELPQLPVEDRHHLEQIQYLQAQYYRLDGPQLLASYNRSRWIWAQLCSKFGYDQPATNIHDVCRWIYEIKTKNSAFTGLILKLSFTAVIHYVWREINSKRHEGNPSSKQNFWRVHGHPAQPSMAECYSSSNPLKRKVNTDGSVAIEATAAAIARDFIGHPLWAFRKTVEWTEIWKVELYAIYHTYGGDGFTNGHSEPLCRV
ncbi:unnamed protein product [Ilex paraguariensis]|uniref:Uncharacterized protein n=1 Tax=Ilex paraguariensis TaxID=185542 RepID=A0ABC8TL72_9AQUA